MAYRGMPLRVLVVPGLHGSDAGHWQTWLQGHFRHSLRVEQPDWATPDLGVWSAQIARTLAAEPPGPWVAVAHSFGCLALAHHLARGADEHRPERGIAAALLVAPAEPERFPQQPALSRSALGVPGTLLASDTDPWMSADSARRWAERWSLGYASLGDAGHINVASGFGPLPRALHLTRRLMGRVEQTRRAARANVREFSFAV